MELGIDRDAKRHRRWQNGYLAGAIVFGLVALIDLAGTGFGLLSPGYVFDDGEFPAEIIIFSLATALGVVSAFQVRRHARRRAERIDAAGQGTWLPELTGRNTDGQVDLEVETSRLLSLAARALLLVFLWLVVLAGGMAGFGLISASSDRLLATGTHVTGRVVSTVHRRRGQSEIRVDYPVAGVWKTAEISWDSDRAYEPGEAITIVYDPADPARVRTPDEPNDDQFWSWVCGIGVLGALVGVPLSVVGALNWRRRYLAVRRTGWRIASVTVVPDYPVRRNRKMPDIHVKYRDDSRITLRAATSSHGSVPLKHVPDRLAWVGGTDQDMVVLFPHGRWRTPPYAVPVYSLTTRTAAPAEEEKEKEAVVERPEEVARVRGEARMFMIVCAVLAVGGIAGSITLLALDLIVPAVAVMVVGTFGPMAYAKIFVARLKRTLPEDGPQSSSPVK